MREGKIKGMCATAHMHPDSDAQVTPYLQNEPHSRAHTHSHTRVKHPTSANIGGDIMGAFTDVSPTVFSTASKRCDECLISNKVDILCKQASVLDSD